MKKFMQQDGEQHLKQMFKLPNPGLRAYFSRTREGNNEDYRTPLWKGEAREDVVKAGALKLESLGLPENLPSLWDYELEMKSKIGPLSVQKPLADRLEDIEAYYTCPLKYTKKPRQIVGGMQRLLEEGKPIYGLRIQSPRQALADMRLNTNSGAPFFTKRKDPEALGYSLEYATHMLEDTSPEDNKMLESFWKPCAVLGGRGQEGGPEHDDTKQRVVGMFPMAVNLAEATVYNPLIKALQSKHLFPAYISNEAVDHNITRMFDTKGKDDVVVCTDFTKYDQHFNLSCQGTALSVLRSLFNNDEKFVNGTYRIYDIKYNIPIQCDTTVYFEGPHGMASGSGGTNVDESIVHRILQHQAAMDSGTSLNRFSQCNGDDGVLTFPGITVDKVIETYTAYGLEMNPDKQYVSKQECVYLRRGHASYYRKNKICVGVYSTFRALGKLLGQERYYDPDKWSKEMVVLRSLSILENCKFHPYFHEFVDFVLKGDKFKLGLDLPGFFDKLDKYVKQAIDMKESFLGFNRTNMLDPAEGIEGINAGEVVKYLKTKIGK